jgi:hypothetical protein
MLSRTGATVATAAADIGGACDADVVGGGVPTTAGGGCEHAATASEDIMMSPETVAFLEDISVAGW